MTPSKGLASTIVDMTKGELFKANNDSLISAIPTSTIAIKSNKKLQDNSVLRRSLHHDVGQLTSFLNGQSIKTYVLLSKKENISVQGIVLFSY